MLGRIGQGFCLCALLTQLAAQEPLFGCCENQDAGLDTLQVQPVGLSLCWLGVITWPCMTKKQKRGGGGDLAVIARNLFASSQVTFKAALKYSGHLVNRLYCIAP